MMDGNKVMSEMLIRVTDKTNDNLLNQTRSTHRGYVIEIFDDKSWWGEGGLTHPEWRILRVPIKKEFLTSFLVSEAEKNPEEPNQLLNRREFKLDLEKFPVEMKDWLYDKSRTIPILEVDWDYEKLMSFRIPVNKTEDPDVFSQ
jgi:hypothetical protein